MCLHLKWVHGVLKGMLSHQLQVTLFCLFYKIVISSGFLKKIFCNIFGQLYQSPVTNKPNHFFSPRQFVCAKNSQQFRKYFVTTRFLFQGPAYKSSITDWKSSLTSQNKSSKLHNMCNVCTIISCN